MKEKILRHLGSKENLLGLVVSACGALIVSSQAAAWDVGIARTREDWLTELGKQIEREAGKTSGVVGRKEQKPPIGNWRERKNVFTMCVSLSDGYFFPTPNSGYNSLDEAATIMLQCRIICKSDNVDVFVVRDIMHVRDSMVSLTSNDRYANIFGSTVNVAKSSICNYQNYFEFLRIRRNFPTN